MPEWRYFLRKLLRKTICLKSCDHWNSSYLKAESEPGNLRSALLKIKFFFSVPGSFELIPPCVLNEYWSPLLIQSTPRGPGLPASLRPVRMASSRLVYWVLLWAIVNEGNKQPETQRHRKMPLK